MSIACAMTKDSLLLSASGKTQRDATDPPVVLLIQIGLMRLLVSINRFLMITLAPGRERPVYRAFGQPGCARNSIEPRSGFVSHNNRVSPMKYPATITPPKSSRVALLPSVGTDTYGRRLVKGKMIANAGGDAWTTANTWRERNMVNGSPTMPTATSAARAATTGARRIVCGCNTGLMAIRRAKVGLSTMCPPAFTLPITRTAIGRLRADLMSLRAPRQMGPRTQFGAITLKTAKPSGAKSPTNAAVGLNPTRYLETDRAGAND